MSGTVLVPMHHSFMGSSALDLTWRCGGHRRVAKRLVHNLTTSLIMPAPVLHVVRHVGVCHAGAR